MAFVLHELLGLMQLDKEYDLSEKILPELKRAVIKNTQPNWDYVCTVNRWHYSGYAGNETLAVMDTHGSGDAHSGYLYSRYKREDLQEYSVHISAERRHRHLGGEPKLKYQLVRDRKHRYENREIITDWTEVKFELPNVRGNSGSNEKSTVMLLDVNTFVNEPSFLEMTCYRTL